VDGLVGRGAAVPRPGVRAHPPPARAARDARRDQARAAAGGGDVAIAGGASTVRQCLAAGMLDELYLHIVPIILGAGERLLEGVGDPTLEPVKVAPSPAVTHVKYRVRR
jgi:dihydrofolate reductase